MATKFLLIPNTLFLAQQRNNIDGNLRFRNPAKFVCSSRSNTVQVKSYMKSTPSSINKKNTVVPRVPFYSESISMNLVSKETLPENYVVSTIFKTLKWLRGFAIVTMHSSLLLMMMHGHDWALARSGGVMGGHSFSSSSKSSSSSSSTSSRSSSSSSSSSSRPSYSSSSRSSTSSSSSSSSRPSYSSSSRSSTSSSSSSSSRPSYSSSSGSSTSSSSSSSSRPSYSSSWFSSSDTFSSPSWSSSERSSLTSQSVPNHPMGQQIPSSTAATGKILQNLIFWSVVVGVSLFVIYMTVRDFNRSTSRTSVIKLQVGLLVPEQSLQRDLNRIAETADTSTSAGWIDILERTTDSLLQHLKYCISYDSSVDVKKSLEDAEECFKQLSLEDRGKYEEETLANLNDMKNQKIINHRADQLMDTYVVVTILAAASGEIKLPIIKDREDIKNALHKLRSLRASAEIKAVNVIWSPQEENEIMSLEELHQDYPNLKDLST